MKYVVRYRGTNRTEVIEAKTMKEAKIKYYENDPQKALRYCEGYIQAAHYPKEGGI